MSQTGFTLRSDSEGARWRGTSWHMSKGNNWGPSYSLGWNSLRVRIELAQSQWHHLVWQVFRQSPARLPNARSNLFSKPLQTTIIRPWPVHDHGTLLLLSFLWIRPLFTSLWPLTVSPLLNIIIKVQSPSQPLSTPRASQPPWTRTIIRIHPAPPTQFPNDGDILKIIDKQHMEIHSDT